jgi:hypothetical protein
MVARNTPALQKDFARRKVAGGAAFLPLLRVLPLMNRHRVPPVDAYFEVWARGDRSVRANCAC